MSIAALSNIEKTFGKRVLFDKLNITIYEGERVGLIGANGSGKTTLFKVLTGHLVPDAGSVAISKGTRIGHLAQDPVFDPANTVLDEAELAFAELHRLAHQLRDLENEMAANQGEALEKILRQYQTVQHEFDLAGGYAWRHKLEATLQGVGLEPSTWQQNVQTLSGGQRSRLALARLLISEPDLLLLDEPTNHLDLVAIEWLEKYLLSFKGAVLLISHDRFLLDRLATRIVWLHELHLDSFPGNYTAFVQQRELIELTQQRAFEQQQAYIEKQQEFIRRFQAGQRSKEARGRATRLERMLKSDEVIQQVASEHRIRFSLNTDQRAGDQVLNARELSKAYGENKLWDDISLSIRRGDRVGIIGPNGSGKTTLLQVLLGEKDADAGQIKWGANLSIGYYDQRLGEFDPDNSVLEEAWGDRDVKEKEVRDTLAVLLFRGEDVYKPIRLLSGGERARVRLTQLLLDKPNVLLLDEPTNHLDIPSREALESTLGQFGGTILCVSHDRYFLDKVAKQLLVLQPPRIVPFEGNYTKWMQKLSADAARAAEIAAEQEALAKKHHRDAAKPAAPKPTPRKDNPYKRRFGLLTTEQLEKEIAKAEKDLADTQARFADPEIFRDAEKSKQVQAEYDELTEKLQQLEEEYFNREDL
ncbi:MAG TPA: ABC-F family ATP-binding cassette domain-containing protein [Tepidisphaeraceae bacterium]|nr:ABC-F family ATP-binding cassette domain-containing protein [Tepidisphaeraceae bacterium]